MKPWEVSVSEGLWPNQQISLPMDRGLNKLLGGSGDHGGRRLTAGSVSRGPGTQKDDG